MLSLGNKLVLLMPRHELKVSAQPRPPDGCSGFRTDRRQTDQEDQP